MSFPALICRCRGRQNVEQKFPHHNWITVLSIQFVITSSFSVVAPSIYKFITTSPQSPSEELESEEEHKRFWPGLGGSDEDYAWAMMSAPLMELITMPFIAAMVHKLPFTISMLFGLVLYAIGGALYALADNVWMVFIGYSLFGAGSTSAAAFHAYIGEMGSVMDAMRERQGKKKMKFVLYIALSFVQNGGFLMAFGLTSIMAQFPDINPYHWPGWFVTGEAMFIATAVVFCFTETRSCKSIKRPHFKFSSLAELKLFTKLKTKPCIRLICYIFLFVCGYMNGQLYTFLATMITPVLSDKFGLTVEYTSHFLIGIAAAYLVGSVFLLVMKLTKINNRPILAISILVTLVGCIIAANWKSVGHDPCSDFLFSNWSSSGHGSGLESTYQHLVDWCEARSSSSYQCFWNQKSRITGEFCNSCLDACLSIEKSDNIYHFTIGILLIAVSTSVGYVTISAVASDITSVDSQGIILTLYVASGTISRAVSPYWYMQSYLWTERHTLFAIGVNVAFALVLLLSLAALYRNLAPKPKDRDETLAETSAVNATYTIAMEEESNGSSDCALPPSHYFETAP